MNLPVCNVCVCMGVCVCIYITAVQKFSTNHFTLTRLLNGLNSGEGKYGGKYHF